MAENSKREQIITKLVENLKALPDIRTVERNHPSFEELKQFAPTQFPVIGVLGGLPSPLLEANHRGGRVGPIGPIRSDMIVQLQFVACVNQDYDKWISYYLDEIWAAVYGDPKLGGKNWVDKITIEPDIQTGFDPPYIVFFCDVTVTYIHDTTGV